MKDPEEAPLECGLAGHQDLPRGHWRLLSERTNVRVPQPWHVLVRAPSVEDPVYRITGRPSHRDTKQGWTRIVANEMPYAPPLDSASVHEAVRVRHGNAVPALSEEGVRLIERVLASWPDVDYVPQWPEEVLAERPWHIRTGYWRACVSGRDINWGVRISPKFEITFVYNGECLALPVDTSGKLRKPGRPRGVNARSDELQERLLPFVRAASAAYFAEVMPLWTPTGPPRKRPDIRHVCGGDAHTLAMSFQDALECSYKWPVAFISGDDSMYVVMGEVFSFDIHAQDGYYPAGLKRMILVKKLGSTSRPDGCGRPIGPLLEQVIANTFASTARAQGIELRKTVPANRSDFKRGPGGGMHSGDSYTYMANCDGSAIGVSGACETLAAGPLYRRDTGGPLHEVAREKVRELVTAAAVDNLALVGFVNEPESDGWIIRHTFWPVPVYRVGNVPVMHGVFRNVCRGMFRGVVDACASVKQRRQIAAGEANLWSTWAHVPLASEWAALCRRTARGETPAFSKAERMALKGMRTPVDPAVWERFSEWCGLGYGDLAVVRSTINAIPRLPCQINDWRFDALARKAF